MAMKMYSGPCSFRVFTLHRTKIHFSIEFPPLLLCITLLSLIGSAVMFNNHSKLVSGAYFVMLPLVLPG